MNFFRGKSRIFITFRVTQKILSINGHLDFDMGGKSVDQKVYHSIIGSLLFFVHLDPISCLMCVCVQDFKPHPRNTICWLLRES
jgi:hypothetical protein